MAALTTALVLATLQACPAGGGVCTRVQWQLEPRACGLHFAGAVPVNGAWVPHEVTVICAGRLPRHGHRDRR